jgi:hypothetical protein
MKERDIEAYLRDRVKALGGIAFKFVSPGHAGVADRIVCMPGGVVWFVEVKAPGGKLSPLQRLFEVQMSQLDMRYVTIWSKDEVDQWVKNWLLREPLT